MGFLAVNPELVSVPCLVYHLTSLYKQYAERYGNQLRMDKQTCYVLERVINWLVRSDPSRKQWLLLCGNIGQGKSTMMLAISDLTRHYAQSDGMLIRFPIRNASTLVDLYSNQDNSFMNEARVGFLGIDELGIENDMDRYKSGRPIHELLRLRHSQCLPTIIATNCDTRDLEKKYGDAIADRLKEMCEIINFDMNPTSYRQK